MYGNNPQSASDTIRKRHSMENEIIMKESDLGRKLRQKEADELEIRKHKQEQSRLLIVIHQKEAETQKLDSDILQLEGEIKKLKKEMNVL